MTSDLALIRTHWPVELRPAFDALFAIDGGLADVVAKATDPTLAAIKLAWWRERLEGLDRGEVPAEPRLRAAVEHLLPRGISGAMLAELEEGHAELLQSTPDSEVVLSGGVRLFQIAGHLLGPDPTALLGPAGRLYAAGRLQRRGAAISGAAVVIDIRAIPARFRPLTGLAVLAKRDLRLREPEATPGRAFALLLHRLTGRL